MKFGSQENKETALIYVDDVLSIIQCNALIYEFYLIMIIV